jgi:hypothetical protein
MTRDDMLDVFIVLKGYWPHSAPDPDDPADVAVYWQELSGLELEPVAEAIRSLAKTKEFCPPIGILAEVARHPAKVPPYYDPPALPEAPPDDTDDDKVKGYLAAARDDLAAIRQKKKGRR